MERFDPARLDARAAIARYADGKLLSKLAPLVEWVADRIDRPSAQRDAIPRGASRGEVRLEPVTRKVLAFDDTARMVAPVGAVFFLFIVWPAVGITYETLTKDHTHMQMIASVLVCAWLLGCLCVMGMRLITLRRLLATCVVVPSRLTSCRESWGEGDLNAHFRMTFEYWFAGMAHEYNYPHANRKERDLIGETPELLVSPSVPQDVLIRDFYA